jgi:hypothetical protein
MHFGKRSSRLRPHDAAYSSRAPSVAESTRSLAARHCLNPKTVKKWRSRLYAAAEPPLAPPALGTSTISPGGVG